MARINYNEADKYQQTDGTEFLKLVNDKDMVTVQLLDHSMEDVDIFACHEVQVGTYENGSPKTRFVNCLRNYDDPLEECPFCKAGLKTKVVMMLAMYDHSSNSVKIWNRGKSFIPKVQNLYNRWGDMTMKPVDIIRNGKKGDLKTTYDMLVSPEQPYDISDVEKPEFLGGYILDKSPEEMEIYLNKGSFQTEEQEEPTARRTLEPTTNVQQSTRSRRRV